MNNSPFNPFDCFSRRLSFLLLYFVTCMFACTSSPDEEKLAYQKKLESFQVTSYKGAKSVLRASSNIQVESTTVDKLLDVNTDNSGGAGEILKWVAQLDSDMKKDSAVGSPETIDYLKLSKDIWGLQEAMKDSDEDKYPLFLERTAGKTTVVQVDSIFRSYGYSYNNSTEHLLFAIIGAISIKTPPEIVLYELHEVEEKELGRNELLLFKQLLESFYFSMNGWNHMAEENASATIDNLEDKKYGASMLMKPTISGQQIFQNEEQAKSCMQMLAYAMRAYTRYMLGGDEKLNQAEEDIIQATELANRSGIQSDELTLAAALYCLKSDNADKAKELCNKLIAVSSNEINKQLASKVLLELDKGESKPATKMLEERQSKDDFILAILKEYALLTLDKNGMLNSNGLKDAKATKSYFAFLNAYISEQSKFTQYADPTFYENKLKEALK
ncbi:MAG: hypothetical protein ACKVOK_08875 [Flavobacteriales bacterium]